MLTGDAPAITVAVCSAARPAMVAECVAATVASQRWGARDELLVVLNGPDHLTVRQSLGALPDVVRVVALPELGLSRARNLALATSTNELVVFLDDDARPVAGWLDTWRTAFGADPALAAAGGPIELRWPTGRQPRWYDPTMAPYFSALDLGPSPADALRRTAPYRAFGANLAVRRLVVSELGGFDERFGRGGTVLDGGEESDLLDRLAQADRVVGWVPAARVAHLVGPDRARLRWLLARARAQGVADRSFGAARPRLAHVVGSGWGELTRGALRGPDRTAAAARDLARRARLVGRRQVVDDGAGG